MPPKHHFMLCVWAAVLALVSGHGGNTCDVTAAEECYTTAGIARQSHFEYDVTDIDAFCSTVAQLRVCMESNLHHCNELNRTHATIQLQALIFICQFPDAYVNPEAYGCLNNSNVQQGVDLCLETWNNASNNDPNQYCVAGDDNPGDYYSCVRNVAQDFCTANPGRIFLHTIIKFSFQYYLEQLGCGPPTDGSLTSSIRPRMARCFGENITVPYLNDIIYSIPDYCGSLDEMNACARLKHMISYNFEIYFDILVEPHRRMCNDPQEICEHQECLDQPEVRNAVDNCTDVFNSHSYKFRNMDCSSSDMEAYTYCLRAAIEPRCGHTIFKTVRGLAMFYAARRSLKLSCMRAVRFVECEMEEDHYCFPLGTQIQFGPDIKSQCQTDLDPKTLEHDCLVWVYLDCSADVNLGIRGLRDAYYYVCEEEGKGTEVENGTACLLAAQPQINTCRDEVKNSIVSGQASLCEVWRTEGKVPT